MKKLKEGSIGTMALLLILIIIVVIALTSAFVHRSTERKLASEQTDEATEQNLDTIVLETDADETISREDEIAAIRGFMLSAPVETIVSNVSSDTRQYYFVSEEITEEVFNRINGKSYVENPNVSLEDLRYLKVLHYNFEHKPQVGELIVAADLADDYLSIFQYLFEIEYEIEKMHLIDDYWSDEVDNADDADTASCEDNNTSCFCYRAQTNATKLSNHAYGRAIDINPQMNPYVSYTSGKAEWYHENSNDYIDRSVFRVHMIMDGDQCCQIFAQYGFEWGGNWKSIKDYQHFEKEQ